MARRNKKIAIEGNNVISMDPEIAKIFQQSTAISGKYSSEQKCVSVPFLQDTSLQV